MRLECQKKILENTKEMTRKETNRKASKKYYDATAFLTNKKRILKKMDRNRDYIPKLATLIKYEIEVVPKPTVLQETVEKLENKAINRLGRRTFDELQVEAQDRISREAPRGVPPPDLSGLTEPEIQERRKKLKVITAEVHAGFQKLADNKKIKQNTADKYKEKFDQIVEWLGGDAMSNVVELLQDPEKVKEKIIQGMEQKGLSKASLKDYFTPLMTLCKQGRDYLPAYCEGVPVDEYAKIMASERTLNRIENVKRTQEEYVVPYSEIKKALANIKKKEPNSTDHLLVLLYNLVAWRDDVGNLKIFGGDGEPPKDGTNYYSVKENKIYLRDYKTKRQHGPKEYKMPAEVKKIFAVQNREAGGKKKYLVSKEDGDRYKNGKISSLIPQAFKAAGIKDRVTINAIRHSTVANLWNNPSSTNEQKQELADKMNHDAMTAFTVYTRPDFDEEKDKVPDKIDDQLEFLNTTRVAKYFDGKLYFGQGSKPDGSKYYQIHYDDGDSEEMNEREFKVAAALAKKEKSKDKSKSK